MTGTSCSLQHIDFDAGNISLNLMCTRLIGTLVSQFFCSNCSYSDLF